LEAYVNGSWKLVDTWVWDSRIEVVLYSLIIDIHNINGEDIHELARNNIVVQLLKNGGEIGQEDAYEVDSQTVRVCFWDLGPGTYTFKVYRTANYNELVFQTEFWGLGSVNVDSDESVTFTRNMPTFYEIQPRGTVSSNQSLSPYVQARGGSQSYSCRATLKYSASKNYSYPDVTRTTDAKTVSAGVGTITTIYANQTVSFSQGSNVYGVLEANVGGSWLTVDSWVWSSLYVQ
ncbi:MAG TPA: hypothetical protein P5560_14400, partial [Thermotogota bacterium]|nr:hypothetical protein [Thermotogota bacterium]